MNKNTKKIVLIGMFSAIAYIFTLIGHLIPIAFMDFLKYDPKDAIIVIAGFALGPLSALVISVLTALLELITISTTGIIGFVMNVIASATFACIPALIYKKSRKFKAAIIGLLISSVLVVGFMLLWNWLITPLYMGVPREAVVEMLIPVFLPFNALKVILNTILTLLIYKPVVRALRHTGLLSKRDSDKGEEGIEKK